MWLQYVRCTQVRSRAHKEAAILHDELAQVEGRFIASLPQRPKDLDEALLGAQDVSKELLRLQKQMFTSALKGLEEEVRGSVFLTFVLKPDICTCKLQKNP